MEVEACFFGWFTAQFPINSLPVGPIFSSLEHGMKLDSPVCHLEADAQIHELVDDYRLDEPLDGLAALSI